MAHVGCARSSKPALADMPRFDTNLAHRPSSRQQAFGLLSLVSLLSAIACGEGRGGDDEHYSSELYLDRSYSALERAADLVAQLRCPRRRS